VAAALGQAWAADRLSFVEVTIASARLEAAVRALTPPPGRGASGALAFVVPPWEQHVLPAQIAAARLRDGGLEARVLAGHATAPLLAAIARRPPAALFVSVGSRRSAARLPDLVALLRGTRAVHLPIVVGGPAVALDPETCRRSGADLVTNDLDVALARCGFDTAAAPGQKVAVDA
jgi:methylmalonyl-CoA mutase cobalamin-binding subunit